MQQQQEMADFREPDERFRRLHSLVRRACEIKEERARLKSEIERLSAEMLDEMGALGVPEYRACGLCAERMPDRTRVVFGRDRDAEGDEV